MRVYPQNTFSKPSLSDGIYRKDRRITHNFIHNLWITMN